ncbi:non-ribosomal peptide synthetase, partial [Rhodococcus wratislaviensis IFP 2016]
ERPDRVPLSVAQQRMWFLNQFDTASAAYNLPIALRLTGDLDREALRAALGDIQERHEALRTVFPDTPDGPHQLILPAVSVLADTDPIDVDAQSITVAVAALGGAGFDLSADIPLRAGLFREAPDRHVLVLVVHHIAADGWSMTPLAADVMVAYAARAAGHAPTWAPLPVQYADYSLWQRELLGSEDDPNSLSARQIAHWQAALTGVPQLIELPTDRPRPAEMSYRGGRVDFTIPADVHGRLVDLAQSTGTTLFMVTHTALVVLFHRLGAGTDVVIGTPVAGRGEEALDDLVGMFVNTLVLRATAEPGDTFEEVLDRVRNADLAAFSHADVPFERLVEVLSPDRSAARHPLFQVMLSFQNTAPTTVELPGLEVAAAEIDVHVAKFDLQLTVTERYGDAGTPGGLAAGFDYATDLFDESTVASMAERFVNLLRSVAASSATAVGDLPLLHAAERDRLLGTWNDTEHRVPAMCLPELFDAQVARTPDAVAAVFGDVTLTYSQLDCRANSLARHLIDRGVGPESRVGLAMRRSPDLLVGMYAIVKAGGAYVPVDPDHPTDRIGYVLDSAQPVCVLTTSADRGALPAGSSFVEIDRIALDSCSGEPVTDSDRLAPLRPDNPAYVIYTSGSTGRPKGVSVPHRGIVNQLLWMQSEYALTARDVLLQKTATTFDVSLWGYFWPLLTGATMVLATPDGHRDPEYLARVIDEHGVTVTDFVPSMLDAFVASVPATSCATLRHVFVIGEALPPETVTRFRALSDAGLHNLYGPTEAAVSVTYWDTATTVAGTVPIGVPEWNTQVYVLDSRLHPVPPGVAGELYLAGEQLARGYLGRVDLTSDRFVANPFTAGLRMYRTGDLVRWTSAGALEYIGRTDFQVKFRGQRIELGEIEFVLRAQPSVTSAAVLVHSDPGTGDHLVAYVVPEPGHDLDTTRLRECMAASLPAYMIPAALMVVDEFPLNTSGKLDRQALPAPEFGGSASEYVAPRTSVEANLAEIFAEVLGLDRIGLRDNFFDVGGNSLVATRVTSRIRAELGAPLALRDLFDAPTVGALAERIEGTVPTAPRAPLVAAPRAGRIPLSPAQRRMWFLNQFDTASAAYNMPFALRLSGILDGDGLHSAIRDVVDRHESLRTLYPDSVDGPHQVIVGADEVSLDLDVQPITEAELPARLLALATEGFDVTSAVPLRTALLRLSVDEHVLAVVVHHISADGSSMAPLARDILLAYTARTAGRAPSWAPLDVQYADYSHWQAEFLGDETDGRSQAAEQIEFWSAALDGIPDLLELPADRPRPAVPTNSGATVPFSVDAATAKAVADLAARSAATPFMVWHAALSVLLSRLSNAVDVTVGTPVAGRAEPALQDLVGMFVNTLTLRARVSGDLSFADVLGQVREFDLAAFAHADLPFERLVEVLEPARSTARHPLFQVGLSYENFEPGVLELPGLTVSAVEMNPEIAKFDLNVTLTEIRDERGTVSGLTGAFTYAVDLFDRDTVESFADRFARIVAAALADPGTAVGDLPVLDQRELVRVLREWNATDVEVSERPYLARYDEQAARTPDAVAVVYRDVSLTYREFNSRVNRLARTLIAEGAGTETTVAVAARRSIEFLIALHAVLRSGAAYVPLDVDLPAERAAHVIEAAQPVLVLTAVRDEFEADSGVRILPMDGLELDRFDDAPVTDRDRLRPLAADNLAYVIFTSGSTGRPKGVAVSHAGLGSHFEFLVSLGALDETDRVAVKTPQSFDASLWELLWPLAVGARVVIAEPDGHKDPDYLAELIDTEQITAIHFVPSMLAVFTDVIVPSRFSSLRTVFVGGEALSVTVARRFAAVSDAAVLNAYGPAEVAAASTTSWVDTSNSGIVTVGTPVWNTRAYVLDQRLHPSPAGVTGELYLAGTQVSRGYAGRPDLTAERFVANPFDAPGARMYRTGDRLRWNSRGELEYFGRNDFQVKLRGLRIELGEIEAVLESVDSVAQAVVTVYSGAASEQLVAYLVTRAGATVDIEALTAYAESRLPEYMIPDGFVTLDAFPLNASGKLDRAALPAPAVGDVAVARVEPRTPLEETLAALFREALGVDELGVNDSFFALGGDSIVSIQLVSRAKAAGIVFTPRDVFERKSIAALAGVATVASADRLALAELAGGGVGNVELTPVLRSLFDRSGPVGRYSQSVLLTLPTGIERSDIVATVQAVLDRHDALRSRLVRDGADVRHSVLPAGAVDADRLVTTVPVNPDLADAPFDALIDRELSAAADRFDFETPVLTQFVWLDRGATRPGRLLVVAHHLVVDGVSWRIIVPDLVAAGGAVTAGHAPNLPEVGTSLRRWSHGLSEAARQPSTLAQFDYWRGVVDAPDPLLGDRALDPVRDRTSTTQELHVELSTEITGTLLARVPEAFRCSVGDSLLAGFAVALTEWRRARGVPAASAYLTLEGHGREESVVPGADLSRTVGWFTSVYPVRLALEGVDTQDALVGGASAGVAIKAVKEQLLAVPDRGVGYGLLRYLNPATATVLAGFDPPQVVFNYLGKTGMGDLSQEMREIGWVPDLASSRVFSGETDPDMGASATIEINVGVTDTEAGPRLGASVRFAGELLAADDVRELVDLWQQALVSQIEHVVAGSGGGLTPSDVGTVALTQSQIEVWERAYPTLEDVWALSPLQAGFHFHSLLAAEHSVDVYHSQLRMTLLGDVSADRMRAAAAALLERYSNLRVVFVQDGDVTAQIPLRGVEVPLTVVDLSGRESVSGERELEALVTENRAAPFDLSEAPLLRLLLVRTGTERHELAMTNHHILLDGWSIPLIVQDLLVLYATAGDQSALPAVRPYREYLDWLARRDPSASRAAWAHALDGLDEPTLLAPARTGGT